MVGGCEPPEPLSPGTDEPGAGGRCSRPNAVKVDSGRMQLMRTMPFPFVAPVKGVSFHQDVVRGVEVGTRLEVVAEPENEFDANACAVRVDGETLGHLPREIAGRLRSSGELCWSAEVVEVLRGSKATGLRIRLLAPQARDASAPVTHAGHDQPVESALERPAPAGTRDAAAEPEVFARSGRRLGRLVQRTEGSVRVRTDDDRIVAYPETLVSLHS